MPCASVRWSRDPNPGTADSQEAAAILNDFFGREDKHISYQNALVMEEEGELVGVVIFYSRTGVPGWFRATSRARSLGSATTSAKR